MSQAEGDALFLPMLCHITCVVMIYVLLTAVRAPSIWGVGRPSIIKFEPRMSANLSNQFEWPVLFYVLCIILILRPDLYQLPHLWLAWLFVFGRILHSAVQICTENIRLRGIVFAINFLAVMGMWMLLALKIFNGS